jgi:SAM-dependent methyltransferase
MEIDMTEFYDPVLYDLRVGPGSRVGILYLSEAKKGSGPILELGCGTGDVLLPIAEAGFEVAGLDASKAMLDKFRERISSEAPALVKDIDLVEGRMESFSLNRKFGQIFIPNDGVAHLLEGQSLRSALRSCYDHLIPGGRLILDISFFDVQYLGRYVGGERENLRDRGCFPLNDNGAVQVWEQTQFDQDAGILTAKFRYEYLDSSRNVTRTYYRQLLLCPRRPSEVALALEIIGFSDIRIERLIGEGNQGWVLRANR